MCANREGHLNIYRRDQDSVVTGYGEHYRVVAFLPSCGELYARVDHVHGRQVPTPAQILKVARRSQGVKGRWKLDRIDEYESGGIRRSDVYFKQG